LKDFASGRDYVDNDIRAQSNEKPGTTRPAVLLTRMQVIQQQNKTLMKKIILSLCLAILGLAFVPANAQLLRAKPAGSSTVTSTTLKKRHHRRHHRRHRRHHRRHHKPTVRVSTGKSSVHKPLP
jgi:hypothetical protein